MGGWIVLARSASQWSEVSDQRLLSRPEAGTARQEGGADVGGKPAADANLTHATVVLMKHS